MLATMEWGLIALDTTVLHGSLLVLMTLAGCYVLMPLLLSFFLTRSTGHSTLGRTAGTLVGWMVDMTR